MVSESTLRPATNNDRHIQRSGMNTQRRARAQLSCVPCRQGKLRCNRGQPVCDQCVKRARDGACHYVSPPSRKKPKQGMRERLKHLEGLVVNLMSSENAYGTPPSDSSDKTPQLEPLHPADKSSPDDVQETTAHAFGHMTIGRSETKYIGGSHWEAILEDIAEVKGYLDAEEEPEHDEQDVDNWTETPRASTTLLRSPRPVTKRELIDALPPKTVADNLVSLWFNSSDPVLHIIHGPTFQKEYAKFWKDPSNTSVTWIGLLFAILSVAIMLKQQATVLSYSPSNFTQETSDEYRDLAASALVLADYMRPTTYTMECLVAYSECEYMRDTTSHLDLWLLLGLMIRLALRMGYHRDACHYSNISPFQGEMRRRIWHMLWQFDILISFTIGLPSMIRSVQSDTQPPHNLLDRDFSVTSSQLPPPRPVTELTTSSYFIAKAGICEVFGEAADISHSVVPIDYNQIMDLDTRLRHAHAAIPPGLQIRDLEESITDCLDTIMRRFNLELLYQKTRCVLHRRYMTEATLDPRFKYSRTSCIRAAMSILELHHSIDLACAAGGPLEQARWFMSSLTSHDLILASMIICLELHLRGQSSSSASEDLAQRPDEDDKMRAALETSYAIWKKPENSSPKTVKATKALAVMLGKVGAGSTQDIDNRIANNVVGNEATFDDTSLASTYGSVPTYNGDGFHDSIVYQNGQVNLLQEFPDPLNANQMDYTSIGNMFDEPLNLDWESWDKSINGQANYVPDQFWSPTGAVDGLAFNETDMQTFLQPNP